MTDIQDNGAGDDGETRQPGIAVEVWLSEADSTSPLEAILTNTLDLQVSVPASAFTAGLEGMQACAVDAEADFYDWDGRDPRLAYGLVAALIKRVPLAMPCFLNWLIGEEPGYLDIVEEIARDRLGMERVKAAA